VEQPDVFRRVLQFLDENAISYAVVGSVASMSYGESRMTLDMDVLADVGYRHIPLFQQAFPGPEWYVSDVAIKDAIQNRKQFNIIHPESGHKVDIMLPRLEANDQTLQRATRRPIESGVIGFVAHPNDVVIGKLRYYGEGASPKHLTDIAKMVHISREMLDMQELSRKAAELGLLSVWESIVVHVDNTQPLPPDFKMP
jgi:hypothetical protein